MHYKPLPQRYFLQFKIHHLKLLKFAPKTMRFMTDFQKCQFANQSQNSDAGTADPAVIFISMPQALPVRCVMLRLDQAMVERGLCESRERAKRAILAGQVRINSQVAQKPSDSISPADEIILEAGEKFVSRGGYKLEHALDYFKLDV